MKVIMKLLSLKIHDFHLRQNIVTFPHDFLHQHVPESTREYKQSKKKLNCNSHFEESLDKKDIRTNLASPS